MSRHSGLNGLFRILGPLEVRTCEGWHGIGAPKWRTLLATLLLRPGQAVSMDCLADELWGESPPRGVRKQVSGYVLRVRRMIGDPDGKVLVTRSPGYQLLVSRADLDASVFEELLAAGRAALADGTGPQASGLLSEALSLWRGRVLADVRPGPLVAAEVSRLEELRLDTVELRIEADLRCGRPSEVVPEVRRLTTEHPLRERLWNLLMRALHDSGRPAEALEVYARVSGILADQLGTDPGPELRQLHQRILATGLTPAAVPPGDDSLETGRPAFSVHATVPRQLPVPVRHFTGREDELRALDALLDQAAGSAGTVAVAAISGTAGVGKTALAVHWAHRVAGHFPDGQLYANLRGFDRGGPPVPAATVIRDFLDALNVPPDRLPATATAQAGLFRSLLAGKRVLIILDNARGAEQARPLMPGAPGCLAVVTSRARLTSLAAVEGARLLTLDVLSVPESRELLSRHLDKDRTAAEPDAVDELIESCARLPLALSITAARAADQPRFSLAALAEDLRDASRRLDMLDAWGAASSVRAMFSWSWQQLTDPAKRMFRLLGMHPGPDITARAAASLAGLPPGQAHQALHELAGAHLIAERVPGRYAFHDLLRAYAAEQPAT